MPSHQRSERVTLAEAAQLTGIPGATLERWAREGRIPSVVTADGVLVFHRGELLDRWIGFDSASEGPESGAAAPLAGDPDGEEYA